MPTLRIDLQEGFSGGEVLLRIDGKEVYRGSPRTRMQVGMAEILSYELPPGRVRMTLEMPDTGASGALVADLENDVFVGISVYPDGKIEFRQSEEPFGYV